MPCAGVRELATPVDAQVLAAREDVIRAVLVDLKARVGGATYFPFSFYRPGEIRSSQSYLTKFPRALLDVFPELQEVRSEAGTLRPATARGPREPDSGRSGRFQDVRRRLCVERHAVSLAKDHYLSMGASEIEDLGKPFDLLVRGLGAVRHVEVKGSTATDLGVVELTVNEVVHAANHQPTDLVVVDAISLDSGNPDELSARGGRLRVWRDWVPTTANLSPTRYAYELPSDCVADGPSVPERT